MTQTKSEWRARLLTARRSIEPGTRREASAAVVARVASLKAYEHARTLLGYTAIGAELDLAAVIAMASQSGKIVYGPARAAPPYCWQQLAGLEHADPVRAEALLSPVLAVVPGVGFDVCGGRLGRGRGFYDRAIAELRRTCDVIVIGAAYELQVVDRLPRDAWDEHVDLVVTERRIVVADATVPEPLSRSSGGT
jgi:5-formyltetrahydrofolate cyclo-ligase